MYQPYGQPGYGAPPVSRWGMQIDPVTGVPVYTSNAATQPPQNGYANPQVTQFIPQHLQPVATALYAPPQQYPQQTWSYPPPTQPYPPPNQYQPHQPQPSYVAPPTNNPYATPNNSQTPYATTNTSQTTYNTAPSSPQPYNAQAQPVPPPVYTNTYPPPTSSPRTSVVNPPTGGYDAPPPPQIPPYPDQAQQQTYPPPHPANASFNNSQSFSSQQDLTSQIRSSLSHVSINPAQTDQEMLLAKVRSNASSPARVSGYLLKMGGGGLIGAQWQKRWVCFKTDKGKWFLHYSKQPESNDRGKIELEGCRCEKYPNVYMDKSITFYIRPKDGHSRKEYFFSCDSVDELFLWVATINKAAGNVDPNLLPTPSPNTSSSSLMASNGASTDQQQHQAVAPSPQDSISPNDVVIQTQTYTPGTDTATNETTTQPAPRKTTRQESQYAEFLNIYQPQS